MTMAVLLGGFAQWAVWSMVLYLEVVWVGLPQFRALKLAFKPVLKLALAWFLGWRGSVSLFSEQ